MLNSNKMTMELGKIKLLAEDHFSDICNMEGYHMFPQFFDLRQVNL